ncbi:MAG: iron-siderophore ABC transporter substrate-binding protein [Nocardioidaceae bacterium]|nr:iron-siderophore ABC transporter substrate-binding protein [Nocardioidaceae bacterium]
MPRTLRQLLPAAVAALALPLAACSTGSTTDTAAPAADRSVEADAFPVTIDHRFGSTTIEKAPTRVATVSWVNADTALALDVVPVAVPTIVWGNNSKGSTPWVDARLEKLGASWGSDQAPTQYSEADGINYTALAESRPDVILAAYSGLTKEEYTKLSKIAPVVAYPKLPYGTPWQQSTEMIGKALGKQQQAEELVADTEDTVERAVAKYPQVKDKTFIYGNLEPTKAHGVNVYTATDNRPRFLEEIGMEQAPVVDEHTKADEFFIPWSAERADELESDVFVTWVPSAKTTRQIEKDPLLSQIPAIKRGAWVADSDNTLTLAISASSPLSLPWAVDKFLPRIAQAADKA